VREADDLTTFMCRISWKSGSLDLLEPSGPHRACYGVPLPLPFISTPLLVRRSSDPAWNALVPLLFHAVGELRIYFTVTDT